MRDADMPPVFDHYISLGAHCYSAWALSNIGLKKETMPFDWLFSDLAMNASIINDRFSKFLDRSKYVAQETESGTKVGHQDYSEKFDRKIIFNHHDPRKEEDHLRFERYTTRFLNAASRRCYFLAVVASERYKSSDAELLASALSEISPRSFLQIVVNHERFGGRTDVRIAKREETSFCHVTDFYPRTYMNHGMAFVDPNDDAALASIITEGGK